MTRVAGTCGCGKTLGIRNKSGICSSCNGRRVAQLVLSDPAIQARRRAGIAKHFEDPANRARRSAHLSPARPDMPEEERQRRSEWGKELHRRYIATPEGQAKLMSAETRAKRGKTYTDRALSWCPPELRDAYRMLNCKKHYSAAEARAIIEAQIPGTLAQAQRTIANTLDAMRIKQEREQAQAY